MSLGYPQETNVLHPGKRLATANDQNLVRPNVDTIYSTVFYDLSSNDLRLTIPEIPGRYWCFSFYDLYGNNFANVSSLQAYPPGPYRLMMGDDAFGTDLDKSNGDCVANIRSPTPYGLLLVRVLTTGSEADMSKVQEMQAQVAVHGLSSARSVKIPALDIGTLQHHVSDESSSQAEAVLHLLATFSPYNQSEVISDRPWIADMLEHAGIRNGSFQLPDGTSLPLAVRQAESSSYALRGLGGFTESLGHGWSKAADHILGDYGSYYNARHVTSIRGYLALTSDQSFYPVYTAGQTSYTTELEQGEAFSIVFSSKPKLKPTGFWSLTMYDGNGFLVPNKLDRYAVGDRSSLEYRNGDKIDFSSHERDGSFEILLQAADVEPPDDRRRNWLPAPAGGGKMSFSLRFYGAEECMRDGTWIYPNVKKVAALRG